MLRETRGPTKTISTTNKILSEQQHRHDSKRIVPSGLRSLMRHMEKRRGQTNYHNGRKCTHNGRQTPGMLEAKGVGLVEFSHKSWGRVPPHTYLDGKIPIDASYSSPDVKITNFCMLPFISSPGNHRAFIIEATTRSLIGQNLLKTSRPAGRRLVMSQPRAVNR